MSVTYERDLLADWLADLTGLDDTPLMLAGRVADYWIRSRDLVSEHDCVRTNPIGIYYCLESTNL